MKELLKSVSGVVGSFSDIWNVFFNDMDIADIEKQSILRDPVDREIYLNSIEEIRKGEKQEVKVELKNHNSFTLYSETITID
ncbi:hypothetical protein [Chryseobacterium sp. GP-SGM7]|uniref:hypothetical protein n=1 Tax=Chryseobacterium sp. GP-SGM7 TaxID=3411323 RepID=UPI003B94ED5B